MSRRSLIRLALIGATIAGSLSVAPHASADIGGDGGASQARGVLSAYVIYLSSQDAGIRPGQGSLAGSGGTPPPPACWYQPMDRPLHELVYDIWWTWIHSEPDHREANAWRDYWYAQIEAHEGQDGLWHNITCNWQDPRWSAMLNENPLFLWVPTRGPLPPVTAAIMTPRELAQYARDSIVLPDTQVQLNPRARSTVNLDTWVWLDPAVFHPLHIQAQAGPLTVNAEAAPYRLILPRNLPADLTPASGVCSDLYRRYTRGAAPSCAITFGRSSARERDLAFDAEFVLVWRVTWTSSWGTGGTLPDGRFSATFDIPVQEVQTIVVHRD